MGARIEIPEEIKTEVINQGKNGMGVGAIIKFIKNCHHRTLSWSYVDFTINPEKRAANTARVKTAYQLKKKGRSLKRQPTLANERGKVHKFKPSENETDLNAVSKDIFKAIGELKQIYLDKFLAMRRQLIQYIAEAREEEEK